MFPSKIILNPEKVFKPEILKKGMRREVSISIFAILIIAAAILTVYYLNVGPTGFAILSEYTNETSCLTAGYTWENLTEENCTTETIYTNETIDCEPCLEYEDLNGTQGECLTWTSCVNETSAEEETCIDVVTGGQCTGAEEPAVSVSLTEPFDDYDAGSDIPIIFTTTGNNLICSYIVTKENGTIVIDDTAITGCANTTFDLSDEDEDYILTIFVTGSLGNASDSSDFFVDPPNGETTEEEEELVPEVPLETIPAVTKVSLGAVQSQDVNQGGSKQLTVSVQNTGTVPVTSCLLKGDDSGWFSITGGAINLNTGEESSLSFSLNVPEGTSPGEHTLGLSVDCAEATTSQTFTVNVLQKKLDFNITNVQRTREDRVRVNYFLTELAGEDQDVEIYFSIKDASGLEVANASQNRSIGANKTDNFRTNIQINETLEGNLTLSAAFNSQVYSSSVLEPISLGAPIGGFAIFEGVGGAGGVIILVVVVLILVVIFFIARKMRQSGKNLGDLFGNKE